MEFNSLQFLIFLPIVLVGYYILPKKIRYLWLLVASYFFYMCWNAKYALLILFSTIVTYMCGILMDSVKKKSTEKNVIIKKKKIYVFICCAINLLILFFFKYFDFAYENISILLSGFGVYLKKPEFNILLPVGISFYTFQALGYTIDVYRDELPAERNFFRYALILLVADLFKYCGIRVSEVIEKQNLWFRWTVYLLALIGILVFGVWGSSYDTTGFIYFQF